MARLATKERSVGLTPVAVQLLRRLYLRKDAEGNPIETPEELFQRVAQNVASAERLYGGEPEAERMTEEFYAALSALEFLPNSPALMNAGRELQQLSACFVLPVDDSIQSIFETMKQTALIHQSGGGTGFAFSRLRPKNDLVRSSGGRSSGPISFIRVFDQATEAINQGGFRRGANMAVLRVDHPDILEFIASKANGTSLTNFNISVGITDAFMEAVEKDEPFELINPRTQAVVRKLRARELLDFIAQMAWQSGEPGVLFLDKINAKNPTPSLGIIEGTNPCVTGDTRVYTSEGLYYIRDLAAGGGPFEVVVNGASGIERSWVVRAFCTGVRPVHRLRTAEGYEVRLTANHKVLTRRSWVEARHLVPGDKLRLLPHKGGFGQDWATFLELLPDGEEEVFDLTEPVTHSFIANGLVVHNCGEQPLLPYESCVLGSINLSKMVADRRIDYHHLKERVWLGVRFLDDVLDVNRYILPEIERATLGNRKIGLGVMGFADTLILLGIRYGSPECLDLIEEVMSFFHREATQASVALAEKRGVFPNFPYSVYHRPGMPRVRNATRTTIAPTGSLSLVAGCSSGIEPLYALAYQRLFRDGDEEVTLMHPIFRQVAQERGFYSQELVDRLLQGESLQAMEGVPQDVKSLFVTAYDIPHEDHVRVQAGFEKYSDSAVSKTINFPRDATVEDVEQAILLAYRLGCVGITVYRDQSRPQQPLRTSLKVG